MENRHPKVCERCRGTLKRARRTLGERLRYAGAYECTVCGNRQFRKGLWRTDLTGFAACPSCANENLKILFDLDKIDPVYRSPLTWLWRLTGATIYHCRGCRLQFYDPRYTREASAAIARHRREREAAERHPVRVIDID